MPACTLCEKDADDFKEVLPGVYECPTCGAFWEVVYETEGHEYATNHFYNVPWVPGTPALPAEVEEDTTEDKEKKKTQQLLGWDLTKIKKERGIK